MLSGTRSAFSLLNGIIIIHRYIHNIYIYIYTYIYICVYIHVFEDFLLLRPAWCHYIYISIYPSTVGVDRIHIHIYIYVYTQDGWPSTEPPRGDNCVQPSRCLLETVAPRLTRMLYSALYLHLAFGAEQRLTTAQSSRCHKDTILRMFLVMDLDHALGLLCCEHMYMYVYIYVYIYICILYKCI